MSSAALTNMVYDVLVYATGVSRLNLYLNINKSKTTPTTQSKNTSRIDFKVSTIL